MIKYLLILVLILPFPLIANYKNTNGEAIDKTFRDLLRWRSNRKEPVTAIIEISNEWQQIDFINEDNFTIWIGHSTFLIKKNGLTILTDPVFSDRASPLKNFGPKRLISPAMSLDNLPQIDVITISHNHYDHLDIRSLKQLSKLNPDIIFLIPEGDMRIFNKRNIVNVYDFNWWEAKTINDVVFTFTPVQHWSARGLFDRNESLWGGWHIKFSDYSVYHAGDTGYSDDFIETKNRLGSPEYAFIPIGAYDPEWFMSESHVNPEDAVKIMQDLGAKESFGMHWGTFTLTAEDTLEPRDRLFEAMKEINQDNFKPLKPGQVYKLKD